MLIRKRSVNDILPSEITPRETFESRRKFLRGSLSIAGAAAGTGLGLLAPVSARAALATDPGATGKPIEGVVESEWKVDEELNSWSDITEYNNFYEFGTDKGDPARYAGEFNPLPWTLEVSGECEKPGRIDYDEIIAPHRIEERIYRLRCVEAWSMVVPWVGIPLGDLLNRFAPTSKAKYVAFHTVFRPEEMRGQRRPALSWPYVEGLRMDEAMHPLTLLAIGIYGQMMPNQNGAPIRLVVPWKYGFKSIKSIASIEFVEKQPPTSWNLAAPREYGFYSNVNPEVNHPRWSQARERRIGEFFKRDTLMFNGYADEVGALYAGMDLAQDY